MSKILILNGTSSSGKTTLVDAMSEISDALYIRFGIDTLWGHFLPPQYIMFNKKANEGFQLVQNQDGGISTKVGSIGKNLTNSFIKMIQILLDDGFDVITDDVILHQEDLEKYLLLNNHDIYLIGVMCSKDSTLQRERERGNRPIGLAKGQFNKVHNIQSFYDIIVQNENNHKKNAKIILDFVLSHEPIGMKKFCSNLQNEQTKRCI